MVCNWMVKHEELSFCQLLSADAVIAKDRAPLKSSSIKWSELCQKLKTTINFTAFLLEMPSTVLWQPAVQTASYLVSCMQQNTQANTQATPCGHPISWWKAVPAVCSLLTQSREQGTLLPCPLLTQISGSSPRYPNSHVKYVLSVYRNTKLQLACLI